MQSRVTIASYGTITDYREPSGPGTRVDSLGYTGYRPPAQFDPLLAKVICWSPKSFEHAVARSVQALGEFQVAGLQTNIPTLLRILRHPTFIQGSVRTTFLETEASLQLAVASEGANQGALQPASLMTSSLVQFLNLQAQKIRGQEGCETAAVVVQATAPPGHAWVTAPLQGQISGLSVQLGDTVQEGQEVAVLLSMKMEHVVRAPFPGKVVMWSCAADDQVNAGQHLVLVQQTGTSENHQSVQATAEDMERVRPDLQEVLDRRAVTMDQARFDHDAKFASKVKARHAIGLRTARENIADLVDSGSFLEYGPSISHYKSKWRIIWIRDVFCYRIPAHLVPGVPTKPRLESRCCNIEV